MGMPFDEAGSAAGRLYESRGGPLSRALLAAGDLVGANGFGCPPTPKGEREGDEIAAVLERGLRVLSR